MKAGTNRGSKMKIVPIRAPAAVPQQKDADTTERQELDRLLASATFRQVDRLKRFLKFIVTEALDGRGDQLKEYVIGVQVFDKDSSFDPRADPIVRVQARRLRSRLVRYYRDEGAADAVVIEMPKGGYAPVFKNRDAGGPARRATGPALAGQNTIAVLPLADHSAARDLAYFCEGLRQEIVHRLATVKALRVLASQENPSQVAMLLTGGVRKSGDRLRVTLHLVDSPTASYLWSESVDVNLADIFAAQESVADAVINKLEPRLVGAGQRRSTPRPAENLAARNLYLQGRYQMNQRTEEGLRKAVDFFERAIVEDSHYALAYSGLADAYGLLTHYGVYGPADVWTKATSSAASAVMLDPDSSEAHTSLAHVKSTQDWDWSGAEREFQLAITLDPAYATAHHWYAMSCLVPIGRLDEAFDEVILAQSLDPVSSIVARDLALVHLFRRDFEAALEQCDHAIELNPHFSPAYWALGLVQEQRKDFDEAAAAFQRAIHLSPQTPRMQAALARTYALMGKRKEASEILRRLDSLSEQRYISPFEFACMRFALGQTDAGFRAFMKACADRSFELLWMRVDPRLDPVRSDRRFEAAVKQMGLT